VIFEGKETVKMGSLHQTWSKRQGTHRKSWSLHKFARNHTTKLVEFPLSQSGSSMAAAARQESGTQLQTTNLAEHTA
jgi:hypothetical protein